MVVATVKESMGPIGSMEWRVKEERDSESPACQVSE
jgi:hypothetical protein